MVSIELSDAPELVSAAAGIAGLWLGVADGSLLVSGMALGMVVFSLSTLRYEKKYKRLLAETE